MANGTSPHLLRALSGGCVVLALALAGCSYDWTVHHRDAGVTDDADVDSVNIPAPDSATLGVLDDDAGMEGVLDAHRPCDEGDCGANSTCEPRSQRCVCDPSYVETAAGCVPDPCLDSSVCTSPLVCIPRAGAAHCECPAKTLQCGDACVDAASDPHNCGVCGRECAPGLSCQQSVCGPRIHDLFVADQSSCVLFESPDGNYPIRCWGTNSYQLFRNDSKTSLVPTSITGVPAARAMAVTYGRRCIIPPEGGLLRCWGPCGIECGWPSTATKPPVDFSDIAIADVIGLSTAAGGSKGGGNTCGLTRSGVVYCEGTSSGVTAAMDKLYPWPISVRDEPNAAFREISGKFTATCAITRDQRIACWGSADSDGQLGVANARLPGTPFPAVIVQKESGGDLTDVESINVGASSCAVTTDGSLWCWGQNRCGELGVGDVAAHNGAVKVALPDVVQVGTGGGFACARQKSGQISCWGQGDFLGLGATAIGGGDVTTRCYGKPQALAGLPDAVTMSVGTSHSCALRANGQLLCWGYNDAGALGDGTTASRLLPTLVLGLKQP